MEEIKSPEEEAVPTVSELSAEVRVEFIKKIFSHFGLAILLFIVFELFFFNIDWIVNLSFAMIIRLQNFGWVFLFITAIGCIEYWLVTATVKGSKYAAFVLILFAYAFFISPIIIMVLSKGRALIGGYSIITQLALLITMFLIPSMSGFALLKEKYLSTFVNYTFVKWYILPIIVGMGIAMFPDFFLIFQ